MKSRVILLIESENKGRKKAELENRTVYSDFHNTPKEGEEWKGQGH